jgi:AcrR family transcriptional regulator
VKAICEQAMVHRATFYSHFTDKYALLKYGSQEAIQTIAKDVEEASETRELLTMLILEHMKKHQQLYALFLLEKSTESLSTLLVRRLAANFEKTLADLEKQGKHFAIPTSLIAQFQAGAVLRVLSWWAEQEMRMPTKELAGYMHQLLMTIVEGNSSDLRKGREADR